MIPADIDETPMAGEKPRVYVERLARQKALAISDDRLILCADTTVSAGRRILGKPGSEDEARAFLTLLSGRRHRVTTGIAVRHGDVLRSRTVVTQVRFKSLSDEEIARYIEGKEWQGKAGGYAIQGRAAAFIPAINGSYSNVVGLPLAETAALLDGMGYRP